MSLNQFLVLAVSAVIVTVPVVLLVPRTRSSSGFNRLLWAATLLVAFLAGWVALAMAENTNLGAGPSIAGTAVVPALLGALSGAVVLNLPLWLLDRFEQGRNLEEPEEGEDGEEDAPL